MAVRRTPRNTGNNSPTGTTPIGMQQPIPQVQPVAPVATPPVSQTWWQKSKAIFWGLVSNRYARIFFLVILIVFVAFIGAIVNNVTNGSSGYISSSSTIGTTITGKQMPVTINGKDTLVTVGELFSIPYDAKKAKNPSFSFDTRRYAGKFQSNIESDSTIWKENRDGSIKSGEQILPASWGNAEIYVWSKTGQSGVAWFSIIEVVK